jgi:ubiquitin-activating enzyme E1
MNYGLNGDVPLEVYKKTLDNLIVPEFTPRSGVKIQVSDTDTENAPTMSVEQDELAQLADSLPAPSSLAGYRLSPIEFEKDLDLHVEFVTSASNLRAKNYGIQRADKHRTKFVAGKIVPAIATTTSLVTGLICLELYKVFSREVLANVRLRMARMTWTRTKTDLSISPFLLWLSHPLLNQQNLTYPYAIQI